VRRSFSLEYFGFSSGRCGSSRGVMFPFAGCGGQEKSGFISGLHSSGFKYQSSGFKYPEAAATGGRIRNGRRKQHGTVQHKAYLEPSWPESPGDTSCAR
jgi:hypothetical protein